MPQYGQRVRCGAATAGMFGAGGFPPATAVFRPRERPGARSTSGRTSSDRREDVRPPRAPYRRRGPDGTSRRIRAAHGGGAGRPLRAPVVRRRARHPQVAGDPGRPSSSRRSRRASGSTARSLEGAARARERDVIAYPDPGTFQVLPWRRRAGRRGCSATSAGRTARRSPATPAHALAAPARAMPPISATRSQVGAEIEFFLFAERRRRRPSRGRSTTAPTSTSRRSTTASDFRRRTIEHLEQLGIPVKASHHEVAPSPARDRARAHRRALDGRRDHHVPPRGQGGRAASSACSRRSCPSRSSGTPARGMHLHLSLFEGDAQRVLRPGPRAAAVAARAARSSPACSPTRAELTAVTNQWVNSYKRLATGLRGARRTCSWTRDGGARRSCACRRSRPERERGARIELRSPDPGCNPYLVPGARARRRACAGSSAATSCRPSRARTPRRRRRCPPTCARRPTASRSSELARETLGDTARRPGRAQQARASGTRTRPPSPSASAGALPAAALMGDAWIYGDDADAELDAAAARRARLQRRAASTANGSLRPRGRRRRARARPPGPRARARRPGALRAAGERRGARRRAARRRAATAPSSSDGGAVHEGHELLVRPLRPGELRARIARARRRRQRRRPTTTRARRLARARTSRPTRWRSTGGPIDFTYMEYELLKFLATHPGRVFIREALLSRVWGYDYYGGARTVDVHVRRVRAKLGTEHAGADQDGAQRGLPLRRGGPMSTVRQPARGRARLRRASAAMIKAVGDRAARLRATSRSTRRARRCDGAARRRGHPAQAGAFLIAMRVKGEAPDELAGVAQALRDARASRWRRRPAARSWSARRVTTGSPRRRPCRSPPRSAPPQRAARGRALRAATGSGRSTASPRPTCSPRSAGLARPVARAVRGDARARGGRRRARRRRAARLGCAGGPARRDRPARTDPLGREARRLVRRAAVRRRPHARQLLPRGSCGALDLLGAERAVAVRGIEGSDVAAPGPPVGAAGAAARWSCPSASASRCAATRTRRSAAALTRAVLAGDDRGAARDAVTLSAAVRLVRRRRRRAIPPRVCGAPRLCSTDGAGARRRSTRCIG